MVRCFNCIRSHQKHLKSLVHVIIWQIIKNGFIIGETAIDLTDPEDFRMMAILRNTEVCHSWPPTAPEHHGLLCNFFRQVSVERDRRLSLGPDAHKVLKEEEQNIRVKRPHLLTSKEPLWLRRESLASRRDSAFAPRWACLNMLPPTVCWWLDF